jgi:hypothetical protein
MHHDRVSKEGYAGAHGGAIMKNTNNSSAGSLIRTWKARRGHCSWR